MYHLLKNNLADENATALKGAGIEITYRQMADDVLSVAEKLKSIGCRPAVKAAILMPNCCEYIISFFAISAANGVIVPLSTKMNQREYIENIKSSDASILITSKNYFERHLQNRSDIKNINIICIDYNTQEQLIIDCVKKKPLTTSALPDDVGLMVHTSGSAGNPKIAMLTNQGLTQNMLSYRRAMLFDGHYVAGIYLPLCHIYCICAQILTHISRADTLVINESLFFVKDFFAAVEKHKIGIAAFVPYMAEAMAQFDQQNRYNISSLKYITISGAKIRPQTYRLLQKKYPDIQFVNMYGMTEAGSRISLCSPVLPEYPAGSVGKAVDCMKIRITKNSSPLAANLEGEIEISGAGVMCGYYKREKLTSQTIINGWLKTGDIGRIDEKGNIFITARKKNIIISGGQNINPLETEQILLTHPAVIATAVVCQKHPMLQEVPFAFVVKKNGKPLTPTDIIRFCRQQLSPYKIPHSVIFVDELPRLTSYKIDRQKLTQMANSL